MLLSHRASLLPSLDPENSIVREDKSEELNFVFCQTRMSPSSLLAHRFEVSVGSYHFIQWFIVGALDDIEYVITCFDGSCHSLYDRLWTISCWYTSAAAFNSF